MEELEKIFKDDPTAYILQSKKSAFAVGLYTNGEQYKQITLLVLNQLCDKNVIEKSDLLSDEDKVRFIKYVAKK